MATTKSTDLTTAQAGKGQKLDARKALPRSVFIADTKSISTGEQDAADIILYNIKLPTNAIVYSVVALNDTIDGATSALVDVGYFAFDKFTSITSSTKTVHAQNAVLDADALVDNTDEFQTANTVWTDLALDTATMGADDVNKAIWSVLGFDSDPKATVIVGITIATAPGTPAAGDIAIGVYASIPE